MYVCMCILYVCVYISMYMCICVYEYAFETIVTENFVLLFVLTLYRPLLFILYVLGLSCRKKMID